ncbi:MAG: DUF3108 domain-containing protein [Silanimonas sp.]
MLSMPLRSAILLALVTALPLAAAPVTPFSATSEVRRTGDLLGEATLRLAGSGGQWQFTSQTRGTHGLARAAGVRIDESSRFRYVDGRPETLEYRYVQETSFNSRERGAVVDAAASRIALRNRDNRHDVPYVPGVLDRQLVTIALMQAVAAGRQGMQTLQVAGRHEVEAQTWVIGGVEPVSMGAASEQGLRIERRRDAGEGRRTVLWLDQDQDHLPLRIEQREDDGEHVEMRLVRRG